MQQDSRRRLGRYAALIAAVLVVEGVVGGAGGLLFGWLGLFDIGATAQHWPVTRLVLHWAMERSVAAHAPDLPVPTLSDPLLILRGAEPFESDCAPCHGAPDKPASPTARGEEPPPPPLYSVAAQFSPDELHWIVLNGVKFTAMPGWPAQDRGDEAWAMVAFLTQLNTMTPPDYRRLIAGDGANLMLPSAISPEQQQNVETCFRCHGADGEGRDGAFPVLAGLSQDFIASALRSYRGGWRSSAFMETVTNGMSDATIDVAATYFAALPRAAQTGSFDPALIEAGAAIADRAGAGRAQSCKACHAGSDVVPLASDLRGQSAGIIADQLRLLQARPPREAGGNATVPAAVHSLSEDEILAVATYFASQPPGRH